MPHPRDPEKVSLAELAVAVRTSSRRALPALLRRLLCDPRRGAALLAEQICERQRAHALEVARLTERLQFERPLWRAGCEHIAGVDEVGVGPLAGPVVAAAVILPRRPAQAGIAWWPGLDDSKRLSPKARQRLAGVISERAVAVHIGVVDVDELDRLGIGRASVLAMERAVHGLGTVPQHLLVDARRLKGAPCAQTAIIGGDGRSLSIAAASVVAKEYRDQLMLGLAQRHPGYGFEVHAGYGTRAHLAALERLGPSPVHRRSFAPVARLLAPHASRVAQARQPSLFEQT